MTSECPHCGLKFSDPSLKPAFCPNCGARLESEVSSTGPSTSLIRSYFHAVWQILTHPSRFFRQMPLRGGVAGPLAFALVTHWLGSAIGYLWRLLIGGAVGGFLANFMQVAGDVADVDSPGRHAQIMEMTERLQHWFWGAGSVIADPFLTMLRILFISFFVFIGARILVTPGRDGAPREITYESALRIICYGLTPSILSALPLFGGLVSAIYVVVVTVIGAREAYRVETGRAVLIAFFPQIILVALVGMIFFALMIAMFKFFTMSFGF